MEEEECEVEVEEKWEVEVEEECEVVRPLPLLQAGAVSTVELVVGAGAVLLVLPAGALRRAVAPGQQGARLRGPATSGRRGGSSASRRSR